MPLGDRKRRCSAVVLRTGTEEFVDSEELGDVLVGDRYALGHAGGAGSVDEVGDLIGGRCRQRRVRIAGDASIRDVDHRHVVSVQSVGKPGGGEGGDGRGVAEHEPDPGRGQCRVDRQVRRSRLEHRGHGDDGLSGPGQHQRHPGTRPNTVADQQVRQPVRRGVKFVIGDRPTRAAHRHRVRGARHLGGQRGRNRHRGQSGPPEHRAVAPPVQTLVFGVAEQVHRRQGRRGSVGHGHQEPL
ncbi:hypothetical protein LAUMK191_05632 [Mycobacterium attenuatum]|nr:hypothetical protein LAUMK191_05632 [Mycobacterium attenuatum]